jgi:hypothetical protein
LAAILGGVSFGDKKQRHWDTGLPPDQAVEKAGAPVAWTSVATMPITPSRS